MNTLEATVRRTRYRTLVPVGVAAAVAGALTAFPPQAGAVSPDIVISQVYGGGGNSGAPLAADFVELYNRGTSTVTLTGWSVQYASSAGTTWLVTALTGTLAPGVHYLVGEAAGSTGAALPTPDATGSTNMSATAGKVALVTTTTALACGSACHAATGVRDFVGYGGANDQEGAGTAPAPSNTTADLRAAAGATDTDNNAADFSTGAPNPRNKAAGGGSGGGTRIHDIQGAAHLSPRNGQQVSGVPGIVTAKTGTLFWMQDPTPDSAPSTSEGIEVFTSTAPTVAVGDAVTVSGTVQEFRPGGSGGAANLTTTEIATPTVSVLSHGNALPAATVVGSGGRVPPAAVIDDDATGDVETSGTFNATTDGIDFWESLEGMRVQLNSPAVVGPTDSNGEIPVVPAGSGTRTTRGGIVAQAGDFNPERVFVDNTLAATPTVKVGDTLSGAVVGVLSYSLGNFALEVTATPAVTNGGLARETTAAATASQLAVATFNVENLAPADPASKYSALATILVTNLAAPDLVALEEIQDNSGATDDGTVAANTTLQKLVTAITAAGGPTYQWREIDPVNDADGGQPGGNIRQAFLFRTDRGLAFVDRPGGTATAADSVTNTGGVPGLAFSPGRIAPADPAWNSSRKPLAGQFTFHGRTVFAIANHFNSKGGDDPLFGHHQPPNFPSETQRHQQATLVRAFVNQLQAVDATASIVVLGDLNDFDFSQTTSILVGSNTLTDLPRTLPVAERYTYDFQGNSEVLDHILIGGALASGSFAYDVVHVNSEFPDQASDHEPQVVRLTIP